MEGSEINFLDYLIILLRRKRLIAGATAGGAFIALISGLLISPVYRAETKIMPPYQGANAAQVLGQLGGFAGLPGGFKTPNELYMGLLKSRPVLDALIERFALMNAYGAKTVEDARETLLEAITAGEDKKTGIITAGVEDKNPEKAARMANALIEELRNLSKRLAVTEASRRRLFFEEHLSDAKENLIKAEEAMKGFQEKTGAVRLEDQARTVIESIAGLRAQISAKEVGLKVMRTYATAQNPDVRKAEAELNGLREELRGLEAKGSGHNPDPVMPTSRMPALGTEYIRRLREFKYQEGLYEALLKQAEAARLDEARDSSLIQVLEEAIPPEKKVSPRSAMLVAGGTIAGLFFSVLAAFALEFMEKSTCRPENKERLKTVLRHIRPGGRGKA